MVKKMAVVTATRAEYGLLRPVVQALRKAEGDRFRVELIVTGTHLSESYGLTVRDIEADGVRIDRRVPIPVDSACVSDISANQAAALTRFTALFEENRYEGVLLLGDRYETLAIAIAAGNTRTPVFHLCGGDTSEGAIDEWIRHSITKIGYLHFVTNEISRKRVVQLGEDPARVFNFGSTSIDNILACANMTKKEALESVGLHDCRYALGTYHPVSTDPAGTQARIAAFLDAIKRFPDMLFILTKSNADEGGACINKLLDEAERNFGNLRVFASLGVRRYLSLMKHADVVIGNSSSGVIETPSFRVPTVDIGDRQRGRLTAANVIHCGEDADSIERAVKTALSPSHLTVCAGVVSPYGNGRAATQIAEKCLEIIQKGTIDLKKKFYDLETV